MKLEEETGDSTEAEPEPSCDTKIVQVSLVCIIALIH